MLVLDTHVWIWATQGDARQIGRRTRQRLARAGAEDAIRVSVVTMFELTALHTLGRLRLTLPPEQWITMALAAGGVRTAEVSAAIAVDAGRISREALADPLDRLLVATARQFDATFVTGDVRILAYAASNSGVRTLDASR